MITIDFYRSLFGKKNVKIHSFVRTGIIISILYGLAAVIGYFARLVLSRYVPVDLFGLFYSVLTFVLAFSIFCDLSFGQVIQVYIPELRKKRLWKKIKGYTVAVLSWQLLTRLLVIIFLIATAPFFASHYFKNPEATKLIYIFAFAFLLSGFGSFNAGLIGFHYFRTAAFLNLFRIASFLVCLIAGFLYRQELAIAAFAYVFSMLATDILTFILFLKKAMPNFFKVKMIINKEMIKSMFKFGFLLTLSSLALQAIGTADTLTITYFRPLKELGLYQMALPTATIVTFLISWPVGLMMPATIAQLGKAQQRKIIVEVRKLLLLAVLPIIAFFVVFSGEILNLLFKQTSELGAWMLRLLAINQAAFLFVQFSISVLTGLKKAKELLRISIIITVIVIALSIIGSKFFGVIGTITGYFLSFVIFLILARKTIYKACGAKTKFAIIAKIIIVGIICCGVIKAMSLLPLPTIINMIVAGIAGVIVYAGIVLLTGLFKIELVKKLLQR